MFELQVYNDDAEWETVETFPELSAARSEYSFIFVDEEGRGVWNQYRIKHGDEIIELT